LVPLYPTGITPGERRTAERVPTRAAAFEVGLAHLDEPHEQLVRPTKPTKVVDDGRERFRAAFLRSLGARGRRRTDPM
jgi:hypothetical protein